MSATSANAINSGLIGTVTKKLVKIATLTKKIICQLRCNCIYYNCVRYLYHNHSLALVEKQ